MRSVSRLALLLLFGLLAVGCGGKSSGSSTPAPAIQSFGVDLSAIASGQTANLIATFSNGTGVINPGNVSVTSASPVGVTPASSTVYTLSVTGSDGTVVTGAVTVQVVQAGIVATLAGTAGNVGNGDGPAVSASFDGPSGLAVDLAGNVYVADTLNSTIRKITPTGVVNMQVSTLAGTEGQTGSTDGPGATAYFNQPNGLAVDGQGNVYVADTFNHTIRVITAAGVVSTLAGTAGVTGSADGTGPAASFDNPNGLALDAAGNLYVADFSNNTVRVVTPAGVVTTLAGTPGLVGSADGTGAAARFNKPSFLAFDAAGNLYLTDSGNNTIRMITPAGVVTTVAGTPGRPGSANGPASAASFSGPSGIAVDASGNLYVADSYTSILRMVTKGGEVLTLAGIPGTTGSGDGTGSVASFNFPSGLAMDASGVLYLADTRNNTLRRITP